MPKGAGSIDVKGMAAKFATNDKAVLNANQNKPILDTFADAELARKTQDELNRKFNAGDKAIKNAIQQAPAQHTAADSALANCDVKRGQFHFAQFKPEVWDEKKDQKPTFPAKKVQFEQARAASSAVSASAPTAATTSKVPAPKEVMDDATARLLEELMESEGADFIKANYK